MIDHFDALASEETPPKAGAMINTFRAFGYSLQTAIADIIDNSISAEAHNIWIDYNWDGNQSTIAITDDGKGMEYDTLIEAMTPGSKNPNDERDENDLGRFGLGLKTSSFSQCKTLTVITKKKDHQIIKRCWDLDYVNATGRWRLLDYLSEERHQVKLSKLESGTTILWEKLDRLVGKARKENEAARKVFLEEFEKVEDHLSLVFHRYIEKKKLTIIINGHRLEPWDPFMKESEGTQLIARETLDNNQVRVKCYVLPHITKMTPDERNKAKTDLWYSLQGFYIYRNSRLLLHGDWLGLFSKNEHFKNARILIDIPNSLDHEWKIDIKKATATPSLSVRNDLIRLGKITRKAAGKLYRFRGNQIMLDDSVKSFDFQPIWKAKKKRDNTRHYFINPEHPLIAELIKKDSIPSSEFKKIIKLIGENTPVESIIQYHSEDPESHEMRETHVVLEAGTIELAQLMYEALKPTGISKENAIKQIFNIEPFNKYPELIEYLN